MFFIWEKGHTNATSLLCVRVQVILCNRVAASFKMNAIIWIKLKYCNAIICYCFILYYITKNVLFCCLVVDIVVCKKKVWAISSIITIFLTIMTSYYWINKYLQFLRERERFSFAINTCMHFKKGFMNVVCIYNYAIPMGKVKKY